MGRLTRDPEVRYSSGSNSMAVARFTLAVDRRYRRDGEANADFINCVSFGKLAEFAEKYYRQGLKIVVSGRIQTGSYTNRDGQKVYTTDVVVEEQEFAESKANSSGGNAGGAHNPGGSNNQNNYNTGGNNGFGNGYNDNNFNNNYTADGFMNIPDGIDEELPFN